MKIKILLIVMAFSRFAQKSRFLQTHHEEKETVACKTVGIQEITNGHVNE